MSSKALVVIDIQNDITKHYRDIIDNINAAIEWAVAEEMLAYYESKGCKVKQRRYSLAKRVKRCSCS